MFRDVNPKSGIATRHLHDTPRTQHTAHTAHRAHHAAHITPRTPHSTRRTPIASIQQWPAPQGAGHDSRNAMHHSNAMHTKSRMNKAATTQMTAETSLAFFLQVITMQYVMKPPAMP